MPEDERLDIDLAVRLGYAQYAAADSEGYTNLPLDQCVLPVNPFTRIGPIVLIRELVLDSKGNTIKRRGKQKLRRKVRLIPA